MLTQTNQDIDNNQNQHAISAIKKKENGTIQHSIALPSAMYSNNLKKTKKNNKLQDTIRPLAEFASAREFVGGSERRTAAYSNVREDSSTVPTHKLPAEVELCKRSIVDEQLPNSPIEQTPLLPSLSPSAVPQTIE
ncbi:MAG: palindromic element RPE1 domain-containing protein [Rickettsia sp.]|jgi:RPE1 domain-containing protein|nr:palindromic element RPE1 domain-containing protein [Rickettsia sp.]